MRERKSKWTTKSERRGESSVQSVTETVDLEIGGTGGQGLLDEGRTKFPQGPSQCGNHD